MRRSRKIALVLAAVAAGSLAATGAYAYWTTGGSGTGQASTGDVTTVVVNQTSAITGLFPGQGPIALSGNFTNPNDGKVYVSSVTAVVHALNVQTNSAKPACTADDFKITGTAPVNQEIDGKSTGGSWSGLGVELLNRPANQDNCKNVTLQIDYTANA